MAALPCVFLGVLSLVGAFFLYDFASIQVNEEAGGGWHGTTGYLVGSGACLLVGIGSTIAALIIFKKSSR